MDQKAPPPTLLAILVCDQIVQEPISGKHSLLGLFSQLSAAEFPCTHAQVHVFVSLTDGHGQAAGLLRLVRKGAAAEAPILETQGNIEFSNPLAMVDLIFNIANLSLPAPGRYSFDFYCNGVLLGSRPFDVVRAPA